MRQTPILPGVAGLPGTAAEATRMPIARRLAAIMGLGVRGYSLLMATNDEDTHQRVGQDLNRIVDRIHKNNGRVFSFSGDGLMAEFPSAVLALKCSLSIQATVARRNAKLGHARRIEYRVGINSGDVVVQGERTGGDAVNIAARLEQMARPGSIYISRMVFDQVGGIMPASYECLGEHYLKNITQSVTVYVVTPRKPRVAQSDAAASAATARRAVPAASRDHRPSVAVLPFRTQRGDHPSGDGGHVHPRGRHMGGAQRLSHAAINAERIIRGW